MRIRSPKTLSATPSGRIMLNPRCARSRSSLRQKEMAAGLRVEAWGTVAIASCMVASGQGAPTSAGQPCVAYSWSNAGAGWGVTAGGADRVGFCFLRKNASRQGARWISAAVAMARAKRGLVGGALAACAEPGRALPGSTQGETGQGAAAASEAGLVAAYAEGAGTVARASPGGAGSGHILLGPSAQGGAGAS